MDWMQLAKILALTTGILALAGLLVLGAMVWLLNHPKD
jgi:hypothetical protein